MTGYSRLLCASVAAIALGACTDTMAPASGPITELPRELTLDERAAISASNGFGLELIRKVAADDARPNIVLSPLSASMALGMTLNGADGTTFDAMRSALGFDGMTREQIDDVYRGLIDLLTSLDPSVRFTIANAIWAREGVPFYDAFFDAVTAAFDARAQSADFSDPATVAAINAWVREKTVGLIDGIVEAPLDPTLVMLLLNAIYFDGAWTTQFDPDDTRAQDFTRDDESTVQVDMMTLRDVELPTTYGPSYQAVELPYGGEAFSMVLVLPSPGVGARVLLSTLDQAGWDDIVDGLTPGRLDFLGLPKLTLSYGTSLNHSLCTMGMEDAFDPLAADFGRMSPEDLFIEFVTQKTFVEVDERGTRAAAVTAVGVGLTSAGPSFVADRPFLLVIRERLSGTILFVGLVSDPTAQDPGPPAVAQVCG